MTVCVIIPTLDPDTEMCTTAVASVVSTAPESFVLIEHDKNRDGFAATCNRAAKESTSDVLIFLNDDTICLDGWADPLRDALYGTESDAIAGARLLYPDGRIQHSGVFLRRDPSGNLEGYNRKTESGSGEVPAVTGACLALRRKTFEDLGGFDEGYRNGYEDLDLCLRHREADGTVVYVAESTVIHLESKSPGRFDHAAENIALLQERWGDLDL